MMIDDKYIVRNRYSASIAPSNTKTSQIEALQKTNKVRPIIPQTEQQDQQRPDHSHQKMAQKKNESDNEVMKTQVHVSESKNKRQSENAQQDENYVTISRERYNQLLQDQKRLEEIEQLTQQLCTFSLKQIGRLKVHYKAIIHQEYLVNLLHYTMQTNDVSANRLEAPIKEAVVDEIITS